MSHFTILLIMGLWITTHLTPTEAIVAYDCGSTTSNISVISLNNIKPCNIPIIKPKTQTTRIQLLQMTDLNRVMVRQCKIILKRTVSYCGMFSHTGLVKYNNIEFIIETSQEKCNKIFNTGSYEINNRLISGLYPNETATFPIMLAGSVDGTTCEGAEYIDSYGSYTDVVAQGQITFHIYEYLAKAKLGQDEIILRSGVHCKYSKGGCMDLEGGNTYWNLVHTGECKFHKFVVLYEGAASRVKDISTPNSEVDLYTVSTDVMSFSLGITGTQYACNHKIIRTEVPQLLIIDENDGRFFLKPKFPLDPMNIELMTYVNTKLIYLSRHINQQMIAMYNNVIKQDREVEVKVLKNSLILASTHPTEFVYNLMNGPGYIAHVAGEVIRVSKCIPVNVVHRKSKECYQELPVRRGNTTLFMKPKTHVLVKKGTQIDCNIFLAPMYNIDDSWYKITTEIESANQNPEELSPQTKLSWVLKPPVNLATSGIYSEEDLKRYSESIMDPVEKPAVLKTIARTSVNIDTDRQGINLNNFLDENVILEKLSKAWGKVWGFFNIIGTWTVTLSGIYTCFMLIKYVLSTGVRAKTLHSTFGWSFRLCAAAWGAITHHLLHNTVNQNNRRQDKNETVRDIEANDKL